MELVGDHTDVREAEAEGVAVDAYDAGPQVEMLLATLSSKSELRRAAEDPIGLGEGFVVDVATKTPAEGIWSRDEEARAELKRSHDRTTRTSCRWSAVCVCRRKSSGELLVRARVNVLGSSKWASTSRTHTFS